MTSARRQDRRQTPPKTYRLSLKGLLSLPYRLCNPPQAVVAKVRSFGITPIYRVRLEDVLNRKHLPPLGLKDFEEWLLYVEACPENLYFVLWLKEYTSRYQHWARTCKPQRQPGDYRISWPIQSSSQLAMFYARAKQTFFTTGSDYELNLPSDILAPFHLQNSSPHPDPAVFMEVSIEVQKMLQASLDRFVVAAYNNVGNNRVLCGMIAGIFFSLLGGVPPIAVNLALGASRWLRLLALPGLWLGLTILIASLHGVCVGIYIFGDLRQLRKFELARPQISRPQTLSPSSRPAISSPLVNTLATRDTHTFQSAGMSMSPMMTTLPSPLIIPPPAHVHEYSPVLTRSSRAPSLYSTSSSGSSASLTSSEAAAADDDNGMIDISPAYYDPDPIEGPATTPISLDVNYEFPPKDPMNGYSHSGNPTNVNGAGGTPYDGMSFVTASFIHPFDPLNSTDFEYPFGSDKDGGIKVGRYRECRHLPEDHQPISPFDFDSLPPRKVEIREEGRVVVIEPVRELDSLQQRGGGSGVFDEEEREHVGWMRRVGRRIHPRSVIERMQMRCSATRWRIPVGGGDLDLERGCEEKEKEINEKEVPSSPPPQYTSTSKDEVVGEVSEKQPATAPTTTTTIPASSTSPPHQPPSALSPPHQRQPPPPAHSQHPSKRPRRPRPPVSEGAVRTQFKLMRAVPAFASPLTRVLNPIVVRGQWEIVVRSGGIAFLVSCAVVGGLLGVPVLR